MSISLNKRLGSPKISSEKQIGTRELQESGRNSIVLPPLKETLLSSPSSARESRVGRNQNHRKSRHSRKGTSDSADASGTYFSEESHKEDVPQEAAPETIITSAVETAEAGKVARSGPIPVPETTTPVPTDSSRQDGVGECDSKLLSIEGMKRREMSQGERKSAFHEATGGPEHLFADSALQGRTLAPSDGGQGVAEENGMFGADTKEATCHRDENTEKIAGNATPSGALLDTPISPSESTTRVQNISNRREVGIPLFYPGAAIRARIGGGFRSLLALGSDAKKMPTACLSSTSAEKITPSEQLQGLVRGLSPLSWSRFKRIQRSNSVGKVVPAFFDNGRAIGTAASDRNIARHSHEKELTSTADQIRNGAGDGNIGGGGVVGGNGGDSDGNCDASGSGVRGVLKEGGHTGGGEEKEHPSPKRRMHGLDGEGNVGVKPKEMANSETDNDLNNGVRSPTNGTIDSTEQENLNGILDRSGPSVVKKNEVQAVGDDTRNISRRNLTLVDRDQWPALLDKEVNPEEWALDKGEADVLATAKRIGSILVRVVTWNLHAKPTPAVERLRETLLPPGKFHIYAVGTEECQNSIAKSVIVHSKKEWENVLKETLGASYEMLCGHALQATHNAVFAHRGIIPLLRNIRSSAVATGLSLGPPGTTLGNKGGVGISFTVGTTSCIFVNSHLAAHQNNVPERNDQFFQISHGLVRGLGPGSFLRRGLQSSGGQIIAMSTPLGSKPSPAAIATSDLDKGGGGSGQGQSPAVSLAGTITGNKGLSTGEHKPLRIEQPPSPCGSEGVDSAPDQKSLTRLSPKTATTSTEPAFKSVEPSAVEGGKPGSVHYSAEDGATDTTPPLSPDPTGVQSGCSVSPSYGSGASGDGDGSHHRLSLDKSNGNHGRQEREQEEAGGQGGGGGECNSKALPEVFDRVVWAGDLNYRVNAPRPVADLLLSKDMHGVLLKNEQLLLERSRGGPLAPFAGYREGPLNFRPTYKFDTGKDTYDSSSKQRVPAWTDRVLHAGVNARAGYDEEEGHEREASGGMHLTAYRSVEELRTSDHRPVIASFVMDFDQRKDGDESGRKGAAVTNQTSSEVCSVM